MADESLSELIARRQPPPIKIDVDDKLIMATSQTRGGFVDKLEELAQKAQQTRDNTGSLRLESLPPVTITASAFETPLQVALREAREMITAQRYKDCVQPLTRALQLSPGHAEATYLLGYCFTEMKLFEQALRVLLPLRQLRLDPTLVDAVRRLYSKIRGELLLMVLLQNFLLIRTGKYDSAVQRLTQLVQLDPGAGLYHFMLAGCLMMSGKLDQAMAAVHHGQQNCDPDERELIDAIEGQVQDATVSKMLEPARDQVKRQAYRTAHDRLNAIPAGLRHTQRYRDFERYLRRMESSSSLTSRGQAAGGARMGGWSSPKDDDFYFYLAGDELNKARDLMRKRRFDQAEKILTQVVEWTPDFPYANYLYGGCVMSQIMEQIGSRRPPKVGDLESKLLRAQVAAAIGAQDEQIEEAKQMAHVVDELVKQMQLARAEGERRSRDSAILEPLRREFEAIMKGAQRGIRSQQQLYDVYNRMTQLRSRVSQARNQVQSADGRNTLQMLSEAIDQNMTPLEKMRGQVHEAETATGFEQRFIEHLNGIKRSGGLQSWQRSSERTWFAELRTEVQAAKARTTNQEVQQRLQSLLDAINKVMDQLG